MADILHRLNIDAPAETTCLGDYDRVGRHHARHPRLRRGQIHRAAAVRA